jgi:malate dehydrogenase
VEAKLGKSGVQEVVTRDLAPAELSQLRLAAEAVRAKSADVAQL